MCWVNMETITQVTGNITSPVNVTNVMLSVLKLCVKLFVERGQARFGGQFGITLGITRPHNLPGNTELNPTGEYNVPFCADHWSEKKMGHFDIWEENGAF